MSQSDDEIPPARDRNFSFMVTEEEYAAFKKRAEETGTKLSEWARANLRRAAGLPTA